LSVQQVIEQKKSAIELWKRDVPGQLTSVDLSPEHHWVALGFENGVVHFIDAQGGFGPGSGQSSAVIATVRKRPKADVVVSTELTDTSCKKELYHGLIYRGRLTGL